MFDELCAIDKCNVVFSIEDNETGNVTDLTGKDCIVKSIDVHMDPNPYDSIDTIDGKYLPIPKPIGNVIFTVSFITTGSNFNIDLFGNKQDNIKDKKVEDCTIQELLFAVRNKIK